MKKFIILGLLFCMSLSESHAELSGGGEEGIPRSTSSSVMGMENQCTPEEHQKNLDILAHCNENWEKWGVRPKPDASKLRDPNNCSSLASLGTLEGCADALVAFPIFMGELALRGLLATLPTDKTSFAYVAQNGSLQQINAYLDNEFLRGLCKVGPDDMNTYVDQKCPTGSASTNPHFNSVNARQCRQEALQDIERARACRRSSATRAAYRAESSRLRREAQDIKQRQDERKALEAQFERDLRNIKGSCGYHLNHLRGSMMAYLRPVRFVAIEAQNALLPNRDKIQAFNDCVERKTRGKPELRKVLLQTSTGLIEQISGSFKAIQCYKERDRKAMQCEIAMSVLTGGASLSASSLKKLGRGALKAFDARVARRTQGVVAEEAVEETTQQAVAATAHSKTGHALIDRPIGTPKVTAVDDYARSSGRNLEVLGPIERPDGEMWTVIRDSDSREPLFFFKREDGALDSFNGQPMLPHFYVHSAYLEGTTKFNPAYQGKGFNSFLFNRFVNEHPDVNLVSVGGLIATNESVMKRLMSEGYSALDAFRATPAYRIRAENGFTEIIPESVVYREDGMIESLVMRRP